MDEINQFDSNNNTNEDIQNNFSTKNKNYVKINNLSISNNNNSFMKISQQYKKTNNTNNGNDQNNLNNQNYEKKK
mgnify:FL=1